MAHNINYAKGRYSFFSVKEVAWHRLGVTLDNPPTSEEAIKYANLDFEVLKVPNLVEIPDSNVTIVTNNSFTTVRKDTNTILGENLTKKYNVVQNIDAFSIFDNIVGSKQAIFETAGALGNGETIFITAKLPGHIKMPNDNDIVDKYLLLSNSHDGSSSLTIMLTPIRVVCNNTLTFALSRGSEHKIHLRHDGKIHKKLEKAEKLLGLINTRYNKYEEVYQHLAKIKVNDDIVKRLVAETLMSKDSYEYEGDKVHIFANASTKSLNQFELAMTAIQSGAGQEMYEGTALWVFNGFTNYFQNAKNYTTSERKVKNAFFGQNVEKMSEVGQKLLAYG